MFAQRRLRNGLQDRAGWHGSNPAGVRQANGSLPESVPFIDDAGNVYVTTIEGGSAHGLGHGTLVRIEPDGKATVLRTFCPKKSCPEGGSPVAG
jgi:hypothetical protein